MRMNQESRCPSEYYSSNLYRKRYPRKTRCIIKSGNIFCSRMRHVRMQNGPRTSVSVSGKWSCIFCESPSPFANNCILWFIKVFSNLYSHFLHFIRIFFIQLHRKKNITMLSPSTYLHVGILLHEVCISSSSWKLKKKYIYLENKSLLKN